MHQSHDGPAQLIKKKKRPGESETNPAPESVGEFWSKHTDVRERESLGLKTTNGSLQRNLRVSPKARVNFNSSFGLCQIGRAHV